MYKKLLQFDKLNLGDSHSIKKTKVQVINDINGEVVFEGPNKFIIAGSSYTAQNHFPNLIIPTHTRTYNDALGLDNTRAINGIRDDRILLFSIGTDGCGVDQHQVKDVQYSKWCDPTKLIPFRYVDANLDDVPRDMYFGRKDMATINGKIAYYFKKFDSEPQWIQRYVSDKLPVGSNVYDSARTDEIESFVELRFKVSKDDCKQFFDATLGLQHSKINTVSLLTAYEEEINGQIYYQNIRPITKINFPNEPLFDLNKGLVIIYHIYY